MKMIRLSTERLLELLKEACLKESAYWIEMKNEFPETENLVKSSERDEIAAFLLEVCEKEEVQFSIETFSLFVTLLDRFLANYKVKTKYLECLSVACLYIASKLKEEDENISITSEFLLDCECKCSVSELLRMELMILSKFEWDVNYVTHVDFLHIYHALLVNEYNEVEARNSSSKSKTVTSKWKKHKIDLYEKQQTNVSTMYPPVDLDFLHILESQLKQCLCINELTSNFRPHLMAFSLLSMQLEKMCTTDNFNDKMAYKMDMLEMLDKIKSYVNLNDDDLIETCKEQIKHHLECIEGDNSLLNRSLLNEYYFGIVKSFRSSLSAVNTDLPKIEEEDESEEMLEQTIETNSQSNYQINNEQEENEIIKIDENEENKENQFYSCDLKNTSNIRSHSNNENFFSSTSISSLCNRSNSMVTKFDKYKIKSSFSQNKSMIIGLSYADMLINGRKLQTKENGQDGQNLEHFEYEHDKRLN